MSRPSTPLGWPWYVSEIVDLNRHITSIKSASGRTVAELPDWYEGDAPEHIGWVRENAVMITHAVNWHCARDQHLGELAEAAADYAKLVQVESFPTNDIAVQRAYERLRVAISKALGKPKAASA